MVALSVFEKYPDSFRLDHADFPEVCRTTFALGVISDFKQIANDPIQVSPLVKVKIEGMEESDFIPLFFKPKPQYWDGPNYKATDFNQGAMYWEQAWQSFRGDDEVAVLLQAEKEGDKLTPLAVMAFADGVPRIGEDIVKWVAADKTVLLQCSKQSLYQGGDQGPDGLDLKLLHQCERILDKHTKVVDDPAYDTSQSKAGFNIHTWSQQTNRERPETFPPWIGFEASRYTIQTMLYGTYDIYIQHYLIPVGAILYCLQTISGTVLSYRTNVLPGVYTTDSEGNIWSFIGQCMDTDTACIDSFLTQPPPDIYDNPFDQTLKDGLIFAFLYAAPFSQKLYDDTKANATAPDLNENKLSPLDYKQDYPGFVWQQTFTTQLMVQLYSKIGEELYRSTHFYNGQQVIFPDVPLEMTDAELYVRPHTKEELQAAGLWPEGAG